LIDKFEFRMKTGFSPRRIKEKKRPLIKLEAA